ncbi:MAG: class I SAM-dependent methyltransferase [Candidatus Edwardsbacteria bacterium]|nr:class I SAM-dependent methyltransferase [Candidatus Edwardsbacteria bacterium]
MIKAVLKRMLSWLGIGIYRIEPEVKFPVHDIKSPIDHNTRQRMDEFYSNPGNAKVFDHPSQIRFYEQVVELLENRGVQFDDKDCADVGCGTGRLLQLIRDRHRPASLTGYDYSEAGLAVARKQLPGANFFCVDIYQDIGRQYDILFCTEVLEHLLHPGKALMVMTGMLKPGGLLLVTVPDGRKDTFDGHINFWSPESWEFFVRDACPSFVVQTGDIDQKRNLYAILRPNASGR